VIRPHPHLLEIAAWPWLERLSRDEQRPVTLADVPERCWDDCARGGFDCVFLMGVWRRSATGREIARTDPFLRAAYDRALPGWTDADVVGSPYCIQAYEPDHRMGGWTGLDAAHRAVRRRGMQLVLDFVPNHTAFDHDWVRRYPDRYVLATRTDYEQAPADFRSIETEHGGTVYVACGRDPYFPPWTDVAQLNYFNEETRDAMRNTLRSIAAHCDGVRCDMAMLVFNDVFDRTWRRRLGARWPVPSSDFWPEATRAVPQLLYLAEVYWDLEGRAIEQGFHFAYDKRLLDALHAPDAAVRARALLDSAVPDPSKLSRFLENHDEPRSAATLAPRLPACLSLVASLPGLRFFFDGQSEGRRVRTPVQLARWPDEPVDVHIRDLHERVLAFATKSVLHEGSWHILNVAPAGDGTWQNIVAYRWKSTEALAVITVNLGGGVSEAHVEVRDDLPAASVFVFEDALSGKTYNWTGASLRDRGLWVRLEPGRAHLFLVHDADAPRAKPPDQ
jgi:hypothetical protein